MDDFTGAALGVVLSKSTFLIPLASEAPGVIKSSEREARELDKLNCNFYSYDYGREQSYGKCRPHHEFRRSRWRRGNDFGSGREKPRDKPGRGAEDPQAPRAGGTGRSSPGPSRRRQSAAPGVSHNAR